MASSKWWQYLLRPFAGVGGTLWSIGKGIGSLFRNNTSANNVWNGITGNGLTDAQIQANNFNWQMAQADRDFQREMYEQYNSPSALVRQYQDAGLNPAMMFGGTTPTASSSPTGIGSVVPASAGATGIFSLVQSIAQLAKMKSEIKNIDADTANKNASALLSSTQAEGFGIDNKYKEAINESLIALNDSQVALNSAKANEIATHIQLMVSQGLTEAVKRENMNAQTKKILADIGILEYDKKLKEFEVNNKQLTTYMPMVLQALGIVGDLAKISMLFKRFGKNLPDSSGSFTK